MAFDPNVPAPPSRDPRYFTVREKCEPCAGTGYLSKSKGGIHTIGSNKRRKPSCHSCYGRGFNDIGHPISPRED
jgi:hypothetical protein